LDALRRIVGEKVKLVRVLFGSVKQKQRLGSVIVLINDFQHATQKDKLFMVSAIQMLSRLIVW
jgi:hypothetical protein